MRQQAEETTILMQKQRKQWHDAHIKKKQFKEGDWALLFDSKFRDHKAKFTTHWMGPYEIVQVYDNGSVKLTTIDGEGHSFTVNGHRLKLYTKPISKQDFLHTVSQQREVEILSPQLQYPCLSLFSFNFEKNLKIKKYIYKNKIK